VPVTCPVAEPLRMSRRTLEHGGSGPVPIEPRDIEAELCGRPPQVVVGKGVLAMEEKRVHGPKLVLERRRFRGGGRRQGMRMQLGQRRCLKTKRTALPVRRSTRSISRNTTLEYGHW
jgi:hypothetical protein